MRCIRKFNHPAEAWPLLGYLRESGISCRLADDNLIQADPLLAQAIGGVKLLVEEAHEQIALQLTEEFYRPAKRNSAPLDNRFREEQEEFLSWCPACEAYPVYRKKFHAGKTLLAVALTIISYPLAFMFIPKKLHCARCGHSWKN